jgi:integrase
MARFQRGFLRIEDRKAGKTWVLRYYATREEDGKRVERTLPVGLVRDLPSDSQAWAEVEKMHLNINQPGITGRVTFADLANVYIKHELGEDSDKSHTTIDASLRILRNRLIPRWGKRIAVSIKPLEIKDWFIALQKAEQLENTTILKLRNTMRMVYVHAQTGDLIPRTQEANPVKFVKCKTKSGYRPIILTEEQTFNILNQMPQLERTLTVLVALTALRISECLGLQWQDIDWDNKQIFVRRKFTGGKVGEPKTESSEGVVPLGPVLGGFLREWQQQTIYAARADWLFASSRLKGKKPRVANMLAEDYLRPTAVKAGVITEDDPRRFGFHNLRHSLASFLVRMKQDGSKTDPKTVQDLLRHSDVKTTLNVYSQSIDSNRLAAQGEAAAAIFKFVRVQ